MTSEFVALKPGTKAGVEVWRIEKLTVVPWARPGVFMSGDSFIVLHSKPRAYSNGLDYDIYFWLGESTSQDEMGVAAYKTVVGNIL